MSKIQDNSVWRKSVKMAVASNLQQAGFSSCSSTVLETLTEALISYLKELARTTKSYSDLGCRSEITIGDITMGLVELGSDVTSVVEYIRRHPRSCNPAPAPSHPPKQPATLQVGERKSRPSNIPDHLPHFPDSHTFIQTPTHKQPVTNYEAVREKSANQKRDMERALTRFIARTGPTDQLFEMDQNSLFPVIACKKMSQPYLSALDPQDQVFDEDEIHASRVRDDVDSSNVDTSDNPFLQPTKEPRKSAGVS